MNTQHPHDLELGERPTEREFNRLMNEGAREPLLLGIMHYLRDEASCAIGKSTEALRGGGAAFERVADLELGGHELLVQVLMKLEALRRTPVVPDDAGPDGGEPMEEELEP